MGCVSVMNDSNGQAGPQGGRERGFLAQIGSSFFFFWLWGMQMSCL